MEFIVSDLEEFKTSLRSLDTVFNQFIPSCSKLVISVGYASLVSLLKLNQYVRAYNIHDVTLILGMYYFDGIPDSIYNVAFEISDEWEKNGIGRILFTDTMRYHGKVYYFEYDGVSKAIVGSANLTEISPATGSIQCEASVVIDDQNVIGIIRQHLNEVMDASIDMRLASDIIVYKATSSGTQSKRRLKIIRTPNRAMEDVVGIEKLSEHSLNVLRKRKSGISFDLPIKVPTEANKFSDSRDAFTHSNINVCYSKPRVKGGKGRNWYEFQLTVSKKISSQEGYPDGKERFYVVTDDGWRFLAHVSSGDDNKKQFSAVGNELLLGTWVKGRLVSFGLVTPQEDTLSDINRNGVITKEILDAYGCSSLTIEKTTEVVILPSGENLNVWLMTFLPSSTRKAIEE